MRFALHGGVYEKLERMFWYCRGKCVFDFTFSTANFPFLLKSSQDHLITLEVYPQITQLKEATPLCQASELGMRAIKKVFPSMKDHLLYDERGERKEILILTVLFFNLCAKL